MDTSLFKTLQRHHRLEPLLNRLLGVKANGLVIDLGMGCQFARYLGVTLCLTRENLREVGAAKPRQGPAPESERRSASCPQNDPIPRRV